MGVLATRRVPLAVLFLLLAGCSVFAAPAPVRIRPLHVHARHAGVTLALSIPPDQTDIHHLHTRVEVTNNSSHPINVDGFPNACGVNGNNPAVYVLDSHGRMVDPLPFTGASCPVPPAYFLNPGHTLLVSLTVDLKDWWLKARVYFIPMVGHWFNLETKPVHVIAIPRR